MSEYEAKLVRARIRRALLHFARTLLRDGSGFVRPLLHAVNCGGSAFLYALLRSAGAGLNGVLGLGACGFQVAPGTVLSR